MNNLTFSSPTYSAYSLNVEDVGSQPYSNKNTAKHNGLYQTIVAPFLENIAEIAIKTIKEEEEIANNKKGFPFLVDVTRSLKTSTDQISQLPSVIKEKEEVEQVITKYVLQKSNSFTFKYGMKEEEVEEWIETTSSDFRTFARKSSSLEF